MLHMPGAAAFRRAALLASLTLVAAPALADPIDVLDNTVVVKVTAPVTAADEAKLRSRIANAAEAACGSDSRSLRDYRYAVRQSACFRDSYGAAMAQLSTRWGHPVNGTAAGMP